MFLTNHTISGTEFGIELETSPHDLLPYAWLDLLFLLP